MFAIERMSFIGAGHYACYPGDVPHSYRALEPGTATVMVMEYG